MRAAPLFPAQILAVLTSLSVFAVACGDDEDRGTPGVTVDAGSTLTTTEMGGTAQFTVVLDARPTADVTIAVTSDDPTEGTVSPSTLTFTSVNFDAPQTVTVTGQDDSVQDGNAAYTVTLAVPSSIDLGYSALTSQSVSLTNTDDETAGITVTAEAGLTTTEDQTDTDSAAFTVVLNSEPSGDVVVPLMSSDETEVTVNPTSLTFTAVNWDSPQTVNGVGVDDEVADGEGTATIMIGPATSADSNYSGLSGANVTVANTDNDSPGVTVTADEPVTTNEAGGTGDFTVVLNSEPTADVVIAVSTDDTTEGTASPATLTFTTANWDAPQTVTLTGADDALADGNQMYTAVLAAATSADAGYDGVDAADVVATNTDDDSAGITVNDSATGNTTEAGGTTTFFIVLNSEPTADVTIPLTSSDITEGTVAPASVTFTTVNWQSPQEVTATGVNDLAADGDAPYRIDTGAATSADSGYDGLNADDVSLVNVDDDSAGITVTEIAGPLTTTESGGTASFSVVLNSEPVANVTIGVTSSDTTEGTLTVPNLIFTPANWDAPQNVTITGVDDALADGNQTYQITTADAVSPDGNYDGLASDDVSVTNTDNDSAGVTVSPTSGLVTTEAGGTAQFTVVLNSQPTGDVTIPVSSSNTGEGTVSAAQLTFTSSNFAAPQTVTVTGADDAVQDGNAPYTVVLGAAASSDGDYSGFDPSDVSATNTDNDSAGITVTPTSGLVTTEAGGTATFTVVLNSEPTADVTIDLSSSNTGEGTVDAPTTLTFTSVNFAAPQTVTVRGVGDPVFDGDQVYQVITAPAVSLDPNYNNVNAADVSVTNDDNDPGVSVTPVTITTSEAGATGAFTVVLNTAPAANVTISLTSSAVSEGTVSPTSLTFTTANFAAPQTVTVSGVDDAVQDGDQPYTILTGNTASTDLTYNNLPVADVSVTNVDDDSAGITVSPLADLSTSEDGSETDSFTVVLNAEPTADVRIGVTSQDLDEVTVDTSSLVFTNANWDSPQTVTLTGVDDAVADGNQPFTIALAAATSADGNYAGLDATDPTGTNTDDETAGFTVTPESTLVSREDGLVMPTFTVRLTSRPTADVTIAISSGDTGEGTASPASLTFTPANFDAPRTVTVTGADDAVADGDQPYQIITAPATSTDLVYNGLNPADVDVINIDNDSAGITLNDTVNLGTSEAGGFDTFTVVLNSMPTNTVTINLVSTDEGEVTVSPSQVVFTPANFDAPQTVTVTGANDNVQDGDQVVTVRTEPAVSADGGYSGLDGADVTVTNTDDETAGFTVSTTKGLSTSEAGGFATYSVVLNSEPTADVTFMIASDDTTEASVSPTFLTFTRFDWDAPKTVTVTGVDDAVADGDQAVLIRNEAASSADPNYNGRNPADVSVTNVDDETAGVTVSPLSGTTSEDGTISDSFNVVLNSQPLSDVVITLTSSNLAEGTLAPAMLTFTSANWDTAQTVTVSGVDDAFADGNQVWIAQTSAAASADVGYDGLGVSDVTVTNLDDETAGVLVSPTTGLTTNEGGATDTFTVRLSSEPLAAVMVPISSEDTSEGSVLPTTLSFDNTNWDMPQTVTITGVDDAEADGNQTFNITVGPATSGDTAYNGLSGSSVEVTNLDDETAGISVIPTTGVSTNESGTTDTFDVVLLSQPQTGTTVVINITGNPTTEGTLDTSTLTFTPADWDMPQTVTITGVDDAVVDGNQLYFLIGNPNMSTDTNYQSLSPFSVEVTNVDNE